jgi:DeoR/GlpR family transcriptional regulator of sugar metabolism
VDAGKFNQIKPSYFASVGKVDTVITDNGISPDRVKIMEDIGYGTGGVTFLTLIIAQ